MKHFALIIVYSSTMLSSCVYMSTQPIVSDEIASSPDVLEGKWVANPGTLGKSVTLRRNGQGYVVDYEVSENTPLTVNASFMKSEYGYIVDIQFDPSDDLWEYYGDKHGVVPVIVEGNCIWLAMDTDALGSPRKIREASPEWSASMRNVSTPDALAADQCNLRRAFQVSGVEVISLLDTRAELLSATDTWSGYRRQGSNATCAPEPVGATHRERQAPPERRVPLIDQGNYLSSVDYKTRRWVYDHFDSPGVRLNLGVNISYAQQLAEKGRADALIDTNFGIAVAGEERWVSVEGYGGGLPATQQWAWGGGVGFLHHGIGGMVGYVGHGKNLQDVAHGIRAQLRFEALFLGAFAGLDAIVGAPPTLNVGLTVRYPVYIRRWGIRQKPISTQNQTSHTGGRCVDVDQIGLQVCYESLSCNNDTNYCTVTLAIDNTFGADYPIDKQCEWLQLRSGPARVRLVHNGQSLEVSGIHVAEGVPDGVLRVGEGLTWSASVPGGPGELNGAEVLLGHATEGPTVDTE